MTRGQLPKVDSPDLGSDQTWSLWGLDVEQLHAAWWRRKGVQCVHREGSFEPVDGTELFLLLEPCQSVVFDFDEIVESVVWSMDQGLRVKIQAITSEKFREELFRDADGVVQGVRRFYGPDLVSGHTTFIVTSVEDAKRWSMAETRADGIREIRPSLRKMFARVGVVGHTYDCSKPDERERFMAWLVASWTRPDLVIDGLQEVRDGIFMLEESAGVDLGSILPPAWIGTGEQAGSELLVGPDYRADTAPPRQVGHVREVSQIEAPRGRRKANLLPRRTVYGISKRIFDFSIATVGATLLLPVFMAVAVLVVLDDGFPVFFGHERQRRGGRNFKCWKFRTMRRNAESLVGSLSNLNQADGPQVFIENDPRVTRIGRYLRKLQLDELPQLWNVIRGDMSLVGPRPSPERENQFCPAWREMRLSVRPGITGLWQVRRTRSQGEDFQEWIRFDVEYVRTASFILDIKILYATIGQVFRRK